MAKTRISDFSANLFSALDALITYLKLDCLIKNIAVYIYMSIFPKYMQDAYVAISNYNILHYPEMCRGLLSKSFSLIFSRIVYVSVASFCLSIVENTSSLLVWFIEAFISSTSPRRD